MKQLLIKQSAFFFVFSFVIFASSANAASHPEQQNADKLFAVIERRVELMQWVALDKWRHHKAIEDLPREKIVVTKTREQPEKAGILYIDDLTRTQIQIAKNEQQRWMDKWNTEGMTINGYVPTLNELRKQLDDLSVQLIASLHDSIPSLCDNQLHPQLRDLLNSKLKELPLSERDLLWNALLKIRLLPAAKVHH